MIIPPPLKPGATIGIAAPAGGITCRKSFENGIRILHEFGFRTKFPRDLWPGQTYLADTDEKRIIELKTIWNDPEVDAVMAARGGFGSLRLASYLENATFTPQPKRFIGFSDITLLHSLFNSKYDLITLHGPVVTSLAGLSKDSIAAFVSALFDPLTDWQCCYQPEILRNTGLCRGISTGGNLTTIVSTLGTAFAPEWKNKVVILEDTAEPLYRIDRMLTQLRLCGKLDSVAAIILGDFSHGLGLDRIEMMRHHEAIWSRVLELTDRTTSIWAHFPIGHADNNFTIPLGLEITLDSCRGMMSHR
jgi:muramoyltetrapeptide carboxypeptidase